MCVHIYFKNNVIKGNSGGEKTSHSFYDAVGLASGNKNNSASSIVKITRRRDWACLGEFD